MEFGMHFLWNDWKKTLIYVNNYIYKFDYNLLIINIFYRGDSEID